MRGPTRWSYAGAVKSGMRRIALFVCGGLLAASLNASPSGAFTYSWKPANPSALVAYQVGKGVITIASANLLTCQKSVLNAEATPFVYDYKVGSPSGGVLCLAQSAAQIAAYYKPGSPSTVTVNTKSGAVTVTVVAPPPSQASIGHLPFH
jgi:hypothetical protein